MGLLEQLIKEVEGYSLRLLELEEAHKAGIDLPLSYTWEQVAAMLTGNDPAKAVSESTIRRLEKRGKLVRVEGVGKVLYTRSSVLALTDWRE